MGTCINCQKPIPDITNHSGVCKDCRIFKCQCCGKDFEIKKRFKQALENPPKTCSRDCTIKLNGGLKNKRPDRICEVCGKPYHGRPTSRFCSNECKFKIINNEPKYHGKSDSTSRRIEVKCKVCGKTFISNTRFLEKGFGRICSKECRSISRGNFSGSNSSRYVGRVTVRCQNCGKIKEVTPRRSKGFKFCSKKCKDENHAIRMSKSNHPNWKGGTGIRFKRSLEYSEFRKTIFSRDEFRCCKCGEYSPGNLEAHHVYRRRKFPEYEMLPENLVTLCKGCHRELHPKIKSHTDERSEYYPFATKDCKNFIDGINRDL
jgi:endogenous inhibitor of DNA gyrase (YacG/DUF329 family)